MRAAAAAVLEAAPRRLTDAVSVKDLVDGDGARLDLFCNTRSLSQIFCPDARGQAKLGIICKVNGFLLRFESCDRQCGPKRLFLHRAHIVTDIGDNGRLVKKRNADARVRIAVRCRKWFVLRTHANEGVRVPSTSCEDRCSVFSELINMIFD